MEIFLVIERRVHEVKGSYFVYLPKSWSKAKRIAKTKKVYMIELKDGLLIKPVEEKVERAREFEIDIGKHGWRRALNLLLAGYIVGADKVVLRHDYLIPITWRQEIDLMVKKLMGFEVVEEEERLIVVKEITQLYDLDSMVERVLSTTRYMLRCLLEILRTGDKDVRALIERDNDVDRYRYAIERQLHKLISTPTLLAEKGMSPTRIIHYVILIRHVERIADHVVSLAKIIMDQLEDLSNIEALRPIALRICELYDEVLDALKTKSLDKAYSIIDSRNVLRKNLKGIEEMLKPKLRIMATHLMRIADYIADICEAIINTRVAEKLMV
ncbi:hypothetical protein DRN86_03220 [Candidatus Geothermarchaeota archaeon]|nr:MAG: hypothetical protein DRN86_03220 [Candidatus Geothermarchaeota archaeon]